MPDPFGAETLSGVYVKRRDGALGQLNEETRYDEIVGGSLRGIPYTGYILANTDDAKFHLDSGPLYDASVAYIRAGGRAIVARRLPGDSQTPKLQLQDIAPANSALATSKEPGAAATVGLKIEVRDFQIPVEGETVVGAATTWTLTKGKAANNEASIAGSHQVFVDGNLAREVAANAATKLEYTIVIATSVITLGQNATAVIASYKYTKVTPNASRHKELLVHDATQGVVEKFNAATLAAMKTIINSGGTDGIGNTVVASPRITLENVAAAPNADFLKNIASTILTGGADDITPNTADYSTYISSVLEIEGGAQDTTDVIVLPQVEAGDATVTSFTSWLSDEETAYRPHRVYLKIGALMTTATDRAAIAADITAITVTEAALANNAGIHLSAGGLELADPADLTGTKLIAPTCAVDAGRDSSVAPQINKLNRQFPALDFVTTLAPKYSAANRKVLEGIGVNYIHNQPGYGIAYSPGKTHAATASDFRDENNRRVMDILIRELWIVGSRHLGSATGDGPEAQVAEMSAMGDMKSFLDEQIGKGHINSGKVIKNDTKSTSKRTYIDIAIIPVGYREFINVTIGFALSL